MKSVQIRSFFWSVFSRIRTEYGEMLRISPVFSPNAGKYGPEITLYLETFHAVIRSLEHLFLVKHNYKYNIKVADTFQSRSIRDVVSPTKTMKSRIIFHSQSYNFSFLKTTQGNAFIIDLFKVFLCLKICGGLKPHLSPPGSLFFHFSTHIQGHHQRLCNAEYIRYTRYST